MVYSHLFRILLFVLSIMSFDNDASGRFDRLSDRNLPAINSAPVTEPVEVTHQPRHQRRALLDSNHFTDGRAVLMRRPLGAPWSSGERVIFREYA